MDDFYRNQKQSAVSGISIYQLVNVLADAAFVCDHTGRVLVCSEQVIPFFNISNKAKVIGSSLQSFFSNEFVDEAYFLLLGAVNEPNNRKSGRLVVRRGVRETLLADVSFASIVSDDPAVKYVLVTFQSAPVTDTNIELLHKKDGRLSRLCETIITHSGEKSDQVKVLLSQIGETLGAITCSYSQLENDKLDLLATWESPFNKDISPQLCNKQLFDYLSEQKEQLALIRKPVLTAFLAAEPSYNEEAGVKSILGFTITKNNTIAGIVTVVFAVNYSLSELDTHFLQTIIAIIEKENQIENVTHTPSELSVRQIIDCFIDPVYILSHDGIIMEVNQSLCKCFGYEREELIGQPYSLLSSEDKNDIEMLRPMLDKAFIGETQKFEWWGKCKKGEAFPTEVSYSKSSYYNHDVVIVITRDLTEAKKVEDELLRSVEELKESNLSKDKFFGILAHDLKNPFQGLLGFIDLLYEDIDELTITQVKEYLSNVRTASYQTYSLLESLLEWSRIQSGKMPYTPTVFNISEEFDSVIAILDNNASRKQITLVNELDPQLKVLADRNMIHSVIQNIITNAIKFSNSKGRVVMRSRKIESSNKENADEDSDNRDWLEISVADNGIGIPEEILPRLFKLDGQYSQIGTASEPGTGLGLVLCHEMVEKNGGKIWAESVAGQGTTFLFTLPLST